MNEIDWSKAPEGATHYVVGSIHPFEKRVGDDWFYYAGGAWSRVYSRGDDRIASSSLAVVLRPAAPSWSGEGLPPVGVVCEAAIPHTSGPNNERSFIWIEGSVIAYYEIKGKTYAWFSEDDGFYTPAVLEFRPIRTPEQIAADEREAAIDEMLAATPAPGSDISLRVCEKLYDAGYRKP